MNTVTTWQTVSTSSSATEKLGEQLGKRLKGGEVIELISDLGGGKTTLVRGLVRGSGSNNHVASPTFTLSRLYKTPRFNIYHFDFYRLTDPGLVAHELAEAAHDPSDVVLTEWGKIVQHVLPDQKLTITIQTTDENTRNITLTYPKQLSYLVETTPQTYLS